MTIPTGRSCTLLGYLNDGWLHQNQPLKSIRLHNGGRDWILFDLRKYVCLGQVANVNHRPFNSNRICDVNIFVNDGNHLHRTMSC